MQTMVPMGSFTRTDQSKEWALDDNVIQLREWATGKTHLLPAPPIDECTIGAAETCTLRLSDPACMVSRVHACLLRDENKWLLRDLASKNGLLVDGARRTEVVLEPGMEIGIGGITLLAESASSIALRNFLARLLGWRPERAEVVDH